MITVVSAAEPQWVNTEQTAINLNVQFEHLDEKVVFTASSDDIESHGRWLFAMACDGEFGPVAEYVPPTPLEIAARDNPLLRHQQMKQATEQTTHWDMMGDATEAAAWRTYYQQLYVLERAPEWPLVEQWPRSPVCAR